MSLRTMARQLKHLFFLGGGGGGGGVMLVGHIVCHPN